MPSPSSSANSRRIAAAADRTATPPVAAAPRLLIHRPMPESRAAQGSPWTDNVRPISRERLERMFQQPRPDLYDCLRVRAADEVERDATWLIAAIGFGLLLGGLLAWVLP